MSPEENDFITEVEARLGWYLSSEHIEAALSERAQELSAEQAADRINRREIAAARINDPTIPSKYFSPERKIFPHGSSRTIGT